MRKLNLNENSNVLGGEPSGRRCDRLIRRYKNGSDSAGQSWLRICAGAGSGGSDIGSGFYPPN